MIGTDGTSPKAILLEDYKTPAFLVDHVLLDIDLREDSTLVKSKIEFFLNPDRSSQSEALILDGEDMELLELSLDGKRLEKSEYLLTDEGLTVPVVPARFTLEIKTLIDPAHNSSLEGLYLSNGNFCTQCEAQGFRKITFYPDRPDILARFRVRIEADRQFPVLLSNGNLVEDGCLQNGRHFAVWEDPFRKPSYLFALVAGDLYCHEDRFMTMSGRDILLQVYVEKRNRNYCDHAMHSLQKAMKWDEQSYGLEYDLDRYMIVAVDDFNMGAMENKGLNIFNSKYVLAHPETATDIDYLGVESVVGHEYFHNWTGNRVTCRDWFQLSLKEGLTVFRDQQFSADMNSAAVQRIEDVRVLRQHQFPEDGGPMAHPVRPSSYVEINNFYTTTVYNKGAEVIRMMETLLGRDTFVEGVRLYLTRHDGQAVTCDDFVAAMEKAGNIDLTQFKRWYHQAGTPRVRYQKHYDPVKKELRLIFTQECPATPGQERKEPFHIPVSIGLIDESGEDIPLQLAGEAEPGQTTRVLELIKENQEFAFVGISSEPVVSPLRNFSAPVILKNEVSEKELAFRLAHDSDAFSRWEAGQMLAVNELINAYAAVQEGSQPSVSMTFSGAWRSVLQQLGLDKSFAAQLLTLPSEQYLAEQLNTFDPQAIHDARTHLCSCLARQNKGLLLDRYSELTGSSTTYSLDPESLGCRSLANFCLTQLMKLEDHDIVDLCLHQYRTAANMTDRLAAFAAIINSEIPERSDVVGDFYHHWKDHPLLIDKWFSLQALSLRPTVFEDIQSLLAHELFSLENPNRARSLLGAFSQNFAAFHRVDGAGYRLLCQQIEVVDKRNPQLAARLASPFTRWKRLEPERSRLMRKELEKLKGAKLSRDLYEIVDKSLQS